MRLDWHREAVGKSCAHALHVTRNLLSPAFRSHFPGVLHINDNDIGSRIELFFSLTSEEETLGHSATSSILEVFGAALAGARKSADEDRRVEGRAATGGCAKFISFGYAWDFCSALEAPPWSCCAVQDKACP